jgi:hypothetical protein
MTAPQPPHLPRGSWRRRYLNWRKVLALIALASLIAPGVAAFIQLALET